MIGNGKLLLPFPVHGSLDVQGAIATHPALDGAGGLVRAVNLLAAAATMNLLGHVSSEMTTSLRGGGWPVATSFWFWPGRGLRRLALGPV